MAQTTVAQFATELKLTPEVLLEQLSAAGVTKNGASEKLTENDNALKLLPKHLFVLSKRCYRV